MSHHDRPTVLILGAGINGAAIARELAINGVSVCVVDTADLAFGATAYSSRLIHGGLRYLEYGEFDLVRESLAERARLLRLAPQFVHPLRLFIPVSTRWSGLRKSAARFLGREVASNSTGDVPPRGLWLVRMGLWLYDRFARDPQMPPHTVHQLGTAGEPSVDPKVFRWLCSYSDAQIRYPERFVVALLEDARQAAAQNGAALDVFTYHRAELKNRTAEIYPVDKAGSPVRTFEPAAIINATGAWVDETLKRLHIPERQLMAGTKGSHLVSSNSRLRQALGEHGLYAEARDGRPVFVLPFGTWTLIGTTDLPFEGDPSRAVATPQEIQYLVDTVNHLLPEVALQAGDVEVHYSGVRPLPFSGPASPAAVTRRHWLEENKACSLPLYSVIGGKLTTCRSLAETSAQTLLERLGWPRRGDSRERTIPGGENYPPTPAALDKRFEQVAQTTGWSVSQVREAFALLGTRAEQILEDLKDLPKENLAGTEIPLALARWSIEQESARHLGDLVERRLMLLYHPGLPRACLQQLATLLVEAGLLTADDCERELQAEIERLEHHFGKRVLP
jgi:glycerol-3-phosphate dehydrogenase